MSTSALTPPHAPDWLLSGPRSAGSGTSPPPSPATTGGRRGAGVEIIRIHQEDLFQALAIPPPFKYQDEAGPGPADIAKFFRSAMPSLAADDAVWRFGDTLIWNWLIVGTDVQAKNYPPCSSPRTRSASLHCMRSPRHFPMT